MKNKKGFTLVELLAVIAILAILMVLLFPRILEYFGEARDKSFVLRAQGLYKAVQSKYMSDQLNNLSGANTYCSDADATTSTSEINISMEGEDDLKYYIEVDADGKVTNFKVYSDTYKVLISKTTGINVTDIDIDELDDSDTTKYNSMNCSTMVSDSE